ncbi:hypothetical protein MJO28_016641 [Puccinia striiformis f. sp. tritici]|uniref:Uncharacterized protein n=1 Tax=Puccinia striiformis f. sp. tritici TaxID=168172 RepID=A0ACC0DNT1_9BASI|nr:hypothetical protein MJO29_015999 [Puccinia striiformis f. sp. tritici]KAI7935770.1 hypothetical protein MJO28_016641 [Puccinia striiformis f. sp. tritici]
MEGGAEDVGSEPWSIEDLTESTAKNAKTTAERVGEDDECTFISSNLVRPDRETELYTKLQSIYRQQALEDFETFMDVMYDVWDSLGELPGDDDPASYRARTWPRGPRYDRIS